AGTGSAAPGTPTEAAAGATPPAPAAPRIRPAERRGGTSIWRSSDLSLLPATDAQAVGDAVNVVEPTRDQVNLQDGPVVEAGAAQAVEVLGRHLPGVLRQLGGVVEHGPVGLGQWGLRVVPPQR